MTDKRLVCIRPKDLNDTTLPYLRIPKSEAKALVDSGKYVYISKSKYYRYIKVVNKAQLNKEAKERRNKGIPAKQHTVYPGIDRNDLPLPNEDGDLHTVYDLHESIIHNSPIDPVTGKCAKSKQGKGKVIKTIVNTLNVKTKKT